MNIEAGFAGKMGPKLRAEVERQLLEDLQFYYADFEGGVFDWSESCPEGHVTSYLDGWLENWSGVAVENAQGIVIASGWIEFIHGGDEEPLFVFWDLLTIHSGDIDNPVKKDFGIPDHIWNKLPARSKNLCRKSEGYDSNWCNDPLVIQYLRLDRQ